MYGTPIYVQERQKGSSRERKESCSFIFTFSSSLFPTTPPASCCLQGLPHSNSRISGALENPASMTHKLFQCLCDRDWQPTDRLWHISHMPIPTYTDTHTPDQDDSSSQRKPNPHLPEEPDADTASCCKLKGMAPTSSCLNLHHWEFKSLEPP